MIRRSPRWVLLVTALVATLAPPRRARADVARVDVVLVGAGGDQRAVEAVLRELFARLPVGTEYRGADTLDVQAVLTPQAGAPRRLARIWIDTRSRERATIYLVDGPWGRVLVRHVPLAAGLDEVAREEVGNIAETSVGALLGGGTIGVTPAEARADLGLPPAPPPPAPSPVSPAPSPVPPAAPPRPPDPSLHLLAGYGVEAWSTASPIRHGPTLGLGLHLFPGSIARAPSRWSVTAVLLGAYRLPTIVDSGAAGVRLDQGGLRLAAGPSYRLSDRWSARALLGGGLDVAHVEPRVGSDTSLRIEPSSWRTSLLATAMMGMGLRLSRSTELLTAITLDADALDTRYVVQLGGEARPVLVPWRLRPGLTIALDLPL